MVGGGAHNIHHASAAIDHHITSKLLKSVIVNSRSHDSSMPIHATFMPPHNVFLLPPSPPPKKNKHTIGCCACTMKHLKLLLLSLMAHMLPR